MSSIDLTQYSNMTVEDLSNEELEMLHAEIEVELRNRDAEEGTNEG